MLKISQPGPMNHAVTLKLEGRLVGPWVMELKNTCDEHLRNQRILQLDFADVSFSDRNGIALLLNLRSQGIAFLNCSPFLEEELRATPMESKDSGVPTHGEHTRPACADPRFRGSEWSACQNRRC